MKMSSEKKAALYSAVSAPIVDLRFTVRKTITKMVEREAIDTLLFQLEQQLWRKIKVALNLTE